LGAIIGISIAIIVLSLYDFKTVIIATAAIAGVGYMTFMAGSWTFVKRCAHASSTNFQLVWDVVKARSFEKNKLSNGGSYPDRVVDDLLAMLRLVPIFAALIPLYIGQIQVLTTFRTIGYRLWMPTNLLNGKRLPQEILLFVEPFTAVVFSLVLDGIIWPAYHRFGKGLPTHLTRLTVGGISIAIGFFASYGFYRYYWFDSGLSEIEVKATVSIFNLVPMLVLFAIGQSLIMSSGYQMSYTVVPERLRGFSVSVFLVVYAMGSILATCEFSGLQSLIDEPGKFFGDEKGTGVTSSSDAPPRFDLYFLINGCLSIGSVVCLVLLRNYYAKTRQMKIDSDLRQRMLDIAVRRIIDAQTSPAASTPDFSTTITSGHSREHIVDREIVF
jgi:dipeptide/tripeptide permease